MNYDIEDNILGALVLKPEFMKITSISEDHFLNPTNRFIFKLFKKQYEDTGTINLPGLIANYKDLFTPKFTTEVIIKKVTQLTSEIPVITQSTYDYYQQSLFKEYIDNQLLLNVNRYKAGNINNEELLENIHHLESLNIKISDNKLSAQEIYSLIKSTNKNITFRFNKLSRTANIQEHDFVIIGARTGIGKSGFCLNLLEDLSSHYRCLYFNMEIAERQIYQRLISIHSRIPMKDLDTTDEYRNGVIKQSCLDLEDKNFKIINNTSSLANIKRIIINESKKEHCIIFIDHVGLIKGRKGLSLYENTTEIAKELRQITLNYNCTIILVSQLNRQASVKEPPRLSELRDSGELEQSATTVILLHDENYEENLSRSKVNLSFIIAKNRNGGLGKVYYQYNKENQRFDEI